MPFQVLVEDERVRRLGIEPGEEHVHHEQQVDLGKVLLLHPLRDVLAIQVEIRHVEIGAEHGVVVVHALLKLVTRVFVLAGLVQLLVRLEREDRSDAEPVRIGLRIPREPVRFHATVVGHEVLDLIDGEDRRVHVRALGTRVLREVFQNVVGDVGDALLVMVERADVDVVATAVVGVAKTVRVYGLVPGAFDCDGAHELDGERQHVAVGDGLLDHVAVDARLGIGGARLGVVGHGEDVGRGPVVRPLVLLEDGRAGETDEVGVVETPFDGGVHLAELAAMALVDDEDALPVGVLVQHGVVLARTQRGRHLLNRRDDERLAGVLEGADEGTGVLRVINASLLEGVVLVDRLLIEVGAVDQEEHLLDLAGVAQDRRELVGGERLPRTRGMEDVAVHVLDEHAAQRGLHREYLIRSHDHQVGLALLDDEIVA